MNTRRRRRATESRRRRRPASAFESLESRQMLAADLVLTEFMASNVETLRDVNGISSDWIEVHNPTPAAVPLEGWSLTDDPANLDKWQFPAMVLEPGEYLVVFASGRDQPPVSPSLSQDFHATHDGTFLVDLPNGIYQVRATFGDSNRVRDEMAIHVQDVLVDMVTAQAGEFVVKVFDAEVSEASNGQLVLRINDTGGKTANAVINALEITPTDGSDPRRFDFGTAESPVQRDYVGVTETSIYSAERTFGWQSEGTFVARDRSDAPRGLYASFKLRSAGEYVALVSPAGNAVSEFGSDGEDYPRQIPDVSYGLVPTEGPLHESPVGYFATPTPGAPNAAVDAITGPRIRDVTEVTGPLADDQDLVITATVEAMGKPINSVSLIYRVMFGEEVIVPMADDGAAADAVAGDSVFTAVIPHGASGPGEMVRWAVAAIDTAGHGSRAPLFAGVQINSGQFTFTQDFTGADTDGFEPLLGAWNVTDDRYEVTPGAEGDTLATIPALHSLGNRFSISTTVRLPAETAFNQNAAIIFDYNSLTDFKFALLNGNATRWQLGHRDESGWNVLKELPLSTFPDTDVAATLQIDGSVAAMTIRGMVRLQHDFGAPINGGLVGIGSNNGKVIFDDVTVKPAGLEDLEAPEYFGTMIVDPSVVTELPVIYRFVEDPQAADRSTGTRASIFYAGEFYDNVFIRIRGGTSRSWPKKSYKIEFNNGYDFRFRPDLPRVDEINLNTTFTDKAYTRAILAYELQRDSGTPSPETFPIRMQQNGEFFSVALFVEQPDESFLVRHGMDENGAFYKAGRGSRYDNGTYSFDKKTREHEGVSDLQSFINGLAQTDGALAAFLFDNVNIPAQINFMATNVVTQNIDASDKNHFIYRDTEGSGEWHMTPWDIDLTFGPDALNTDTIVADENTAGAGNPDAVHPLLGSREVTLDGIGVKYNDFLDRMIKNPRTLEMLLRRIRTLTDQYLSTTYFQDRIAELVDLLGPDVLLDKERWGEQAHFGSKDFTLVEANDRIKNEYLARRVPYLTVTQGAAGVGIPAEQPADANIEFGTVVALTPPAGRPPQEYFTLVNPNPYAVDISGWRVAGSAYRTFAAGTVIPAGDTLYLTADVTAFRNRPDGPSGGLGLFVQDYAGFLSATGGTLILSDQTGRQVAQASYAGTGSPVQQDLRITELNYNPHTALTQFGDAAVDNEQFEFIELLNAGDEALELDGVTFVEVTVGGDDQGIEFTFGPMTLGAGERVLVVKDRRAFESRYGTGHRIAGEYAGKLANSGEWIRLLAADGAEILSFAYDDASAWPDRADGQGASLEIIDPAGDASDPENWRASSKFGGSPGAAGTEPVDDVVINEVASQPSGNVPDWIELFNSTSEQIDISNWYLSDDGDNLYKFQFPSETTIGSGVYRVFTEDLFNFGLGSRFGEDLWLVAADATTGKPLRFADHVRFGGTDTGVSIGRWPDGNPAGLMFPMFSPTPGATNSGPRRGEVVLSEVYYNPPESAGSRQDFEFVELLNVTETPVSLAGWQIAGGIDFQFPDGTRIEVGQPAVVVGFDPDDDTTAESFRLFFGIDQAVPILGPYTGDLDNDGEAVRLVRPLHSADVRTGKVLVDRAVYDDRPPWATSADGIGPSLNRRSADAFGDFATSWIAQDPTPGSILFTLRLGDMDGNGKVDQEDVDDFVLALRSPSAYQAEHGVPATLRGDLDQDGDIDFDDIDELVALLAAARSSRQP